MATTTMNNVVDGMKSRIEELEELLAPGGELNRSIYEAALKIRNARDDDDFYNCCGELDEAANAYMKYAIEYDRLTRK